MRKKILVEVGYYDFYFDYMPEAMGFARAAAEHISDNDKEVRLTAIYEKPDKNASEDGEEETSENGED